jgi:multidrug efflux pump subunit AcrA (membrane-fusion protein)
VFNIEKEKQEMAQLRATQDQQKALRQTALAGAKLTTDKANLKLDELREDAAAFSVKAPFDGLVLYGQLQRGAWQNADPKLLRPDDKVNPGQVVITFVAPGKMRLIAEVPESKLGMVKPGLTARVIPTGHAEASVTGTCGDPSPAGVMREWGQVFPTPIDLRKVDPGLMPGSKGVARIDAGQADNALLVPVSAVARGRAKVREADGEEKWRDVVTGRSDGENVEILDGLKEGERVLNKPVAGR